MTPSFFYFKKSIIIVYRKDMLMQTYRPHENTKIEVGKFKDSFVCYWRYIRIILREIGTPISFEIDVIDANEKRISD